MQGGRAIERDRGVRRAAIQQRHHNRGVPLLGREEERRQPVTVRLLEHGAPREEHVRQRRIPG